MKKSISILLTFLLCTALLAGCSCEHEWTDATCTDAKHCTKCEAVDGGALGHNWTDPDCVTPKTCSRCGLTEGSAPGHTWAEATCKNAKTCAVCAATEGQPLEHTWEGEATLYNAPSCSVCGTEGEPLPGYFALNGLAVNIWAQLPADYVTNTYVRPDLDTTGMFLSSEVLVFESDARHRAKAGYEWRSVDIKITFSDSNSSLYGTNVTCARADYYQDTVLKPADKQERFAVTYRDKEYKCTISYEDTGFYFTDDSSVFHMTCYAQVPAGYDGVVLAFHHSAVPVSGLHLHELEDENMLLVRLA